MSNEHEHSELVRELLRAELVLSEAYARAVERLDGKPELIELRTLRDEAVDATARLRRQLASEEARGAGGGGRGLPPKSGDSATTSSAPAVLLRALHEAERAACGLCQRTLGVPDLDPEVRRLLAGTVLHRHEEHLRRLGALTEKAR